MSVNLKEYLPLRYENIKEFDEIMRVESLSLDNFLTQIQTYYLNSFIQTANLEAIETFENEFDIVADPITESIQFRRDRLLNRSASIKPYTFRYLLNILDRLIGVNKYNAYIVPNDHALYIESSAENQQYANELSITINKIKPAHIIFTNTPLISATIGTNETISLMQNTWNYKLNGSWKLGEKPFLSITDMGNIKMPNIASINANLLNANALNTASVVNNILINDTISITSFVQKNSTDNTATIKYNVQESETTLIENIKMRNSSNAVLSNNDVYIPVVDFVELKHTIPFTEVLT
jgi:hypothetical protein